jgi:hypothetical protein
MTQTETFAEWPDDDEDVSAPFDPYVYAFCLLLWAGIFGVIWLLWP